MDKQPDCVEHPLEAMQTENPEEMLPILCIKQESLNLETPPLEPLQFIAVKEGFLDIKEEPWDVNDLVEPGDNSDECNTDYKNINLEDGLDKILVPFSEEDSVGNNAVDHNTSPDSGLQFSLNVKPSSLPEYNIPSVHQYSSDTVMKSRSKMRNTSTVCSTGKQERAHEANKTNKQTLRSSGENDIFSDTCPKSFNTPNTLKKHIIIHTGNKPYTCDTCDKCFSRSDHLKEHIRIHTGNKPYTCDTCHKCFSKLFIFKRHLNTHTGSSPYTCDTCHKCFSELSKLNKHKKIHTGSRPFTCDTCRKCFRRSDHLKEHMRTHTGNKPYTCDICHKSFRRPNHLKGHIRIHREQTIHL